MITEFAPAKINLYLHVTGRRGDGYHDLDSLAAFAGVGDRLALETAASFSLSTLGPRAHELAHEPPTGNLIVKAAESLAALAGKKLNCRITLTKNLPTASGIGGGSSDAAAALRLLAQHWGLAPNDPRLVQAAGRHGQDVPVCLETETCRMTAQGVEPASEIPHCDMVLVNPGKALPTADVYKAFKQGGFDFSPAAPLTSMPADAAALAAELGKRGNDLAAPAIQLLPEIGDVLKALQASGALLARMSGSGASCFGLYPDRDAARSAAAALHSQHAAWWVAQTYIPYCRDRRRDPAS